MTPVAVPATWHTLTCEVSSTASSVVSDSCDPRDCGPPRLLRHGTLRQEHECVRHPLSAVDQSSQLMSCISCWQAASLPLALHQQCWRLQMVAKEHLCVCCPVAGRSYACAGLLWLCEPELLRSPACVPLSVRQLSLCPEFQLQLGPSLHCSESYARNLPGPGTEQNSCESLDRASSRPLHHQRGPVLMILYCL